jgi:hypothetical protein
MAPVDGIPHQFCITGWQLGRLPKSGIRAMTALSGFCPFEWRVYTSRAKMLAIVAKTKTGK